ncbi:MAG: M56 family metallopeptidase [Pyrinomonadaceae bacterium]|nr:polysaccharide deacetylase family protein [Acidobacteriota bacterium]
MTQLDMLFGQAIWQTLGRALIHSIWQGALVALLYAGASVALSRAQARARYVCACLCLSLALALPVATFITLHSSVTGGAQHGDAGAFALLKKNDAERHSARASARDTAQSASALGRTDTEVFANDADETNADARFVSVTPWLGLAWLIGAVLLSLKTTGAWLWTQQLKRASVQPVSDEWQARLAHLSRRLRVSRPVLLCESALVEAPTVIGWLRPVILLPASALTGLSSAQLAALLAHELAHIRRHDYFVNLLQAVVEILLFYHPAVWWLSHRVRIEREFVCDDMAVAATGDALIYARALTTLEQLRRREGSAALVVAANGGSLMQRIQRLIKTQTPARRRHLPLAAGLSVMLLALASIYGAGAQVIASAAVEIEPAAKEMTKTSSQQRKVAVTFVGLPVSQMWYQPRAEKKTRQLLAGLNAHGIPAVGFVTARDLYQKESSQLNEERVNLLRLWLDAGMELGVSSYSHPYFYKATLADFQQDVERGEQATRKLVEERGRKVRYFSYPYLNTGPDRKTKAAFEKFLAGRGYQMHPVTIDNMDWLYGKIYSDANRADDEERMQRVAGEYVPYMEKMMEFYEQLSRDVMGYEVPQVLMLTGNALNAEKLDDLVAMLKRRGYTFITLEEALKDPAYSQPDTYTGPTGISWLQRWAITKGGEFRTEPYLSDFMSQFDPKKSGSDFKNRKAK